MWDKVFKNEPSKICERQPLKDLTGYGLLKQSSGGVLRKRCSEICSKFTGEHQCQSLIY